jgi:large subunit ribosomal protein L24
MTQARVDATGLDLAAVMPSDARPTIGGRMTAKVELEAVGLSPRALIGSVTGSGNIRIDDGYFSGLDPKAFETIIRASDQGLAVGTSKIHDVVAAALNSGVLRIPRIETTVTINAGQVRPANTVAVAVGADLMTTGSLDLTQQQIDARLTLTGMMRTDASTGRPDIFIGVKGPLAAPQKTVDVSALAGWLTIRRIEQQAKKLEALEAARREAEAKEAAAREAAAREAAARQAAAREAAAREAAAKEAAAKEAAAKEAAARDAAAKEAAAARAAPEASVPSAAGMATTPAGASPQAESAKPPTEARATITPPQPLVLAPALPPAREIRRIPRQPESLRGTSPQSSRTTPGMPLWLPGAAQPSVMDSLVGTPLKR